jgi:hypothetical protein
MHENENILSIISAQIRAALDTARHLYLAAEKEGPIRKVIQKTLIQAAAIEIRTANLMQAEYNKKTNNK